MDKYRKPNAAQAKHLRRFMADHPQYLKCNYRNDASKQISNNMWDKLSRELNSLGPPTRDKRQWKKVKAIYFKLLLIRILIRVLLYFTDMGRL